MITADTTVKEPAREAPSRSRILENRGSTENMHQHALKENNILFPRALALK